MTTPQVTIDGVAARYKILAPFLNESQKRLFAGAEAAIIGHGGIRAVAKATGLATKTVQAGRSQVLDPQETPTVPQAGTIRQPGAGRPLIEVTQPGIVDALLNLVEPSSRGDPDSPLRWTCKSLAKLSEELAEMGFDVVSPGTIGRLLKEQNFSLQAPRKTHEGGDHPDRNAQFHHINETVKTFQNEGQPVISVDAKKKELVGQFYNKGQEWQPKGEPEEVEVYDFPTMAKGKAVPYGVYDVQANEGWVSVGMGADTAEFAVKTIETWWERMGQQRYSEAERLLITADCGGSNSYRTRLWKTELQRLSDVTGLEIRVLHYPPGTSKWNKIEHRLFNHVSMNWRGRPLESFEVVVNCIASTTTSTGLRVEAALDEGDYEKGIKISNKEMRQLNIEKDAFHGEWNYGICPKVRS